MRFSDYSEVMDSLHAERARLADETQRARVAHLAAKKAYENLTDRLELVDKSITSLREAQQKEVNDQ